MCNNLITIGWLGSQVAYLNVPKEQAIERFVNEHNDGDPVDPSLITEFTFGDTFGVYDAWKLS
jgi:hypothetical protein